MESRDFLAAADHLGDTAAFPQTSDAEPHPDLTPAFPDLGLELQPLDQAHIPLPEQPVAPQSPERSSRPQYRHTKPSKTAEQQAALLAEQREYYRRMEAGWYAQKLLDDHGNPDPTHTTEQMATPEDLALLVDDAAAARTEFILANQGLVYAIARRYVGPNGRSNHGVTLEELEQQGRVGLVVAVEKYDYHRGIMFSTHASWWIRKEISNMLRVAGDAITLPTQVYHDVQKLYRMQEDFKELHGRPPTTEELAQESGLSEEIVESRLRARRSTVSLSEAAYGPNDDTTTLIDRLVTDQKDPFDAQVLHGVTLDRAQRMIADILRDGSLTASQVQLVILEYGIGLDAPLSREDIAKKMGITQRQVTNALAIARRKLAKEFTYFGLNNLD